MVESYRDINKKTKHRIVMSLGKVDDNSIPIDARRLSALAEQNNIACGVIKKEDIKSGKSKYEA